MASLLVPRRRRGRELLDDAHGMDAGIVERSMVDVERSNALFGGTRAVLAELALAVRDGARSDGAALTLLDVGTGTGDIPARAGAWAMRAGVRLVSFGVESCELLARRAATHHALTVRATALALPFADASVDIAMCSQVLHHFDRDGGIAVVRELDRVARRRVIVSDIRRSWLAAAGIWAASFPLLFHPVSRHDGVLSVLRGFTRAELAELVCAAVGHAPVTRNRIGFRTTASWVPSRVAA